MTHQEIINLINTYIKTNGQGDITGSRLNTVLKALADYFGVDSVEVTTLPAGSEATANVINNVLLLGIPRGKDGIDATNPFKGWFSSLSVLQSSIPSPSVGEFAYVPDPSPATTTSIYECLSAGAWTDSGRDVDTSDVHTFETGEQLNQVKIVNSLATGGEHDVASAETVKALKNQGDTIVIVGEDDVLSPYSIGCLANHTYRIYPDHTNIDVSGVTVSSSEYDYFNIIVRDSTDSSNVEVIVNRKANTKTQPLDQYYDVTPTVNGFLRISMRCSETVSFKVLDVTNDFCIPRKTVVGYIANNTVSLSGTNNRVSWYVVPKFSKVSVKSACKDVILARCTSVGQTSGLTPLFNGNGNNSIEFCKYFAEETVVALTWIVGFDWYIKIEPNTKAFEDVYGGKSLLEIYEGSAELSHCRLLDVDSSVFPYTNYFWRSLDNPLTQGKTISISDDTNSNLQVSVTNGHVYAVIETVRTDEFTPYSESLNYYDKGGIVMGFANPAILSTNNLLQVEDEDLASNYFSYAPTIADKKYKTLIRFATAQGTGNQCVVFGSRRTIDNHSIFGRFYLDNAFVVDLTELFGAEIPSYYRFVKMFGQYLELYTAIDFDNFGYSDKDMKIAFVKSMNKKALQLGMTATSFSNPGGTDTVDNYFTANDALKMLCAFGQDRNGIVLSSIPSYACPVERGGELVSIQVDATYKGQEQVTRLSPYVIVAGKTGTLSDNSHQNVGGYNMNTANVGLIVKSPVDGALLAGVVILPLTKQGGSWKTQSGGIYPYNDRYDVLKDLFDLLESKRAGNTVTQEQVNALACGYAAACVLPEKFYYNGQSISEIQKNGDTRCWPASMTKLMTLLCLTDNYNYNETFEVYGSDIMGGSGIAIQEGDKIKGSDAIIAMMLPSTNTLAAMFSRIYGSKFLV